MFCVALIAYGMIKFHHAFSAGFTHSLARSAKSRKFPTNRSLVWPIVGQMLSLRSVIDFITIYAVFFP